MPHYADGVRAKVGDIVTGTSYNKGGVFVGVIKKITSENDTCNAIVERNIAVVSSVDEENGQQVITRTNYFNDGEDYTEVRKLQRVVIA